MAFHTLQLPTNRPRLYTQTGSLSIVLYWWHGIYTVLQNDDCNDYMGKCG
jgi:hypothetical protein